MTDTFKVGIDFENVLAAISKQIYDTPLAFIRENVQNAVDAVRMQAKRDGYPSNGNLSVQVTASPDSVEIRDNGIGMTLDDLQNFFWTIGASGKRTAEAREAGCVGMFGIGGFANFGTCSVLSVTSQSNGELLGHETKLSRADIEEAGGAIPDVTVAESYEAAPRGTVVKGTMSNPANVVQLEEYLRDCVKLVQEYVYFNGMLLSRQPHELPKNRRERRKALTPHPQEWTHGNTTVRGQLYEGPDNTLHAELTGLRIGGASTRLDGRLAFEKGVISVLKRGFKICATAVGTQIGISGHLDCDLLSPTAGRDSLDPESGALIASIIACMERAAIGAVLESSERIAQHTRIFRYVRLQGLIGQIGNTLVNLADGSESKLTDIQHRKTRGVRVFYSTSRNPQLANVLQARGHTVVQLPYDSHKRRAVRDFLITYCGAEAFDGRVECLETYSDLTRFERYFLSELEETILGTFEVTSARLEPGRLSEDIPVYAPNGTDSDLIIFVDVRHTEVTKLQGLGITSLFRSMVVAFCREYLGQTLKAHSPRFFGSGALNLEFLSKRRSELWILLTKDIETLTRGTQRQIVRTSDIQRVQAGGSHEQAVPENGIHQPKLVRIDGSEEFTDLFGYYLRVPNSATNAYGDVIQQCEERAALWAGNKITFFATDGISTAFQFDVRLDQLITTADAANRQNSGAIQMERPVQALYEGLYFPIPELLEPYLVPAANEEIRIEVRCEWSDYSTARTWEGIGEQSGH